MAGTTLSYTRVVAVAAVMAARVGARTSGTEAVTGPRTALVFPVAEICRLAREHDERTRGSRVELVRGAVAETLVEDRTDEDICLHLPPREPVI